MRPFLAAILIFGGRSLPKRELLRFWRACCTLYFERCARELEARDKCEKAVNRAEARGFFLRAMVSAAPCRQYVSVKTVKRDGPASIPFGAEAEPSKTRSLRGHIISYN
jgi:hypothetical protein